MRVKTATRSIGIAPIHLVCGAATLLLLFGSAIASAAGYSTPCDVRDTGPAHAKHVAEPTLNITVVDLTDDAAADLKELNRAPTSADESAANSAPLLFLAPRVETIVREVFSNEEDAMDEDTGRAMPPLADVQEVELKPLTTDEEDDVFEVFPSEVEGYSPLRIYREMYRTDI